MSAAEELRDAAVRLRAGTATPPPGVVADLLEQIARGAALGVASRSTVTTALTLARTVTGPGLVPTARHRVIPGPP